MSRKKARRESPMLANSLEAKPNQEAVLLANWCLAP
uniref:Uncharacterized protein n=1 Tax=Peronospora matthiolae TaxID=2874970 RepID=A0AAV1TUY8_9STRA